MQTALLLVQANCTFWRNKLRQNQLIDLFWFYLDRWHGSLYKLDLREIWGSGSGVAEDSSLFGCYVISTRMDTGNCLACGRFVVPSFSFFSSLLVLGLGDLKDGCSMACDAKDGCSMTCDAKDGCIMICDPKDECSMICDPKDGCSIICNPKEGCSMTCRNFFNNFSADTMWYPRTFQFIFFLTLVPCILHPAITRIIYYQLMLKRIALKEY